MAGVCVRAQYRAVGAWMPRHPRSPFSKSAVSLIGRSMPSLLKMKWDNRATSFASLRKMRMEAGILKWEVEVVVATVKIIRDDLIPGLIWREVDGKIVSGPVVG